MTVKRKLTFKLDQCGVNVVAKVNGVVVAFLVKEMGQFKESNGKHFKSEKEWRDMVKAQVNTGKFDKRVESFLSYEAALKRLKRIAVKELKERGLSVPLEGRVYL